jgi:hypothetical protein
MGITGDFASFIEKFADEKKKQPTNYTFFDETMRDRVKVNKYGGLGRHRFVIILSSKINDDKIESQMIGHAKNQ